MYSISAHICSSFYKSMPICAILIGQAINDTEVDAKLAAVRGMWQRFTYHQAIKQEAERQKQQYNYTEEWATYYSSLTDDDAFSTLIQVFHTWCTDKPILSYYICLHCPPSSNSGFTGRIRQYVSIVTFTKRCEQSRNLTFFWHYILELSAFFGLLHENRCFITNFTMTNGGLSRRKTTNTLEYQILVECRGFRWFQRS